MIIALKLIGLVVKCSLLKNHCLYGKIMAAKGQKKLRYCVIDINPIQKPNDTKKNGENQEINQLFMKRI